MKGYFKKNNYIIAYYLSKNKTNNLWELEIPNNNYHKKSLFFYDNYKKICIKKLEFYMENIFSSIKKLSEFKKEYALFYQHEPILRFVTDSNFGYHISAIKNHNNIMNNGLIPNGLFNQEVFYASLLIDKYKPKTIPYNINRAYSNYFFPEIRNEDLVTNKYNKGHHLYAVDISTENKWVGSMGLGGFCLALINWGTPTEKEEYSNWAKNPMVLRHSKLYWKHSVSWQDFCNNQERILKDKYGIDEILVSNKIEPSKIIDLGYWDNNGYFIQSKDFIIPMKNKYINNYKEILEKY